MSEPAFTIGVEVGSASATQPVPTKCHNRLPPTAQASPVVKSITCAASSFTARRVS